MQFGPNYKPFRDAIRELKNSLTPKQRERYDKMDGYFAKRLRKISKSKSMEQRIAEVEAIKEKCRDDYYSWHDAFQENFSGELNAVVDWFDRARGMGMVTITGRDGETVRSDIYSCNIKGRKTWYPETACVYYEDGQQIKVTLSFHGRCSPIFVCGVTPGHFDSEGWDRIKDQKLAFRCDDEGNAVTGLFE